MLVWLYGWYDAIIHKSIDFSRISVIQIYVR